MRWTMPAMLALALVGLKLDPGLLGRSAWADLPDPLSQTSLARLASAESTNGLGAAGTRWINVTDRLRPSLVAGVAMPVELSAARSAFESAWLDAGRLDRAAVEPTLLNQSLSLVIRSYRFQEGGNPERPNALRWADEMISFNREVGDRRNLVEAMLEKGAIYLEMSQLVHTNPRNFERISADGDRLLQDAYGLAEGGQRPEVLRYWSRFYYNLARPRDGILSKPWDLHFLALADQRIDEAINLDRDNLRNLNQKARVTQRRARATIDAPSAQWSDRLWTVQRAFADAWKIRSTEVLRPEDRISPLNVLATLTFDAISYEIAIMDAETRARSARRLLEVLDEVALPAQRDAWATVRNSDLARQYGFDTLYDLARIHSLRAVLGQIAGTGRQNEDVEIALSSLREARALATVRQLDATVLSLTGEPVFAWLPPSARARATAIIRGE